MNESQESQLKALSFRAIARDVGILWGLTLAGGIIVGASGFRSDPSLYKIASTISSVLLCTIGFTIVGCLVGPRRWNHLFVVTAILWLTDILNLLLGVTLRQWILFLPIIFILMGVGGGISYIFRR
jgi:hypothetical protein